MANVKMEARLSALEAEMADVREQLKKAQTLAKIERGIAQMHRGEGIPARVALEALRKKYKIPAR